MRIVVISLHTSPVAQPGQGDAGGLNVYAWQSALMLHKLGHEVDIFTADPAQNTDSLRHTGSAQFRHPAQHRDHGLTNDAVQGGTPDEAKPVRVHHLYTAATSKDELSGDRAGLVAQLQNHPAFAHADVLWAHYWISADIALAARNTHSRLIVSFHTIGAVKNRDTETQTEPATRLAAERTVARAADLLVANTEQERRDIVSLLGAASQRVCVAYPGVDDIFRTRPASSLGSSGRTQPAETPHTLLYVGRMQYVKGTDIAIDAMRILKQEHPKLNVSLLMLGAGSGRHSTGEFLSRARTAGVANLIDIAPPVPPATLVEHYRKASAVLVPSRSESFGFVAAEAAAAGAVVIGARVGGLPVILDHGKAGVLVEPGNAPALADAIAQVLHQPDRARRLAVHAAAHARKFTWKANVETVLNALAAVTDAAVTGTEK